MDEIIDEARRRILVEKEMARLRAREAMPKYVVLCGLVLAIMGFLLSAVLLEYFLKDNPRRELISLIGFGLLVGGIVLLLYGMTLWASGKNKVGKSDGVRSRNAGRH